MDVLEELGNGYLKRHEMLCGVAIIPVFMLPDWFKRFVKVTCIYFFIPVGSIPKGPAIIYKVLKFCLYFPFLGHQTWDWSQVQFMGRFVSTLSSLHRTASAKGRGVLRQFWCAHD